MTDTQLLLHLAALMGWEVYKDYEQWRVHCLDVRGKVDNACYVDTKGQVWIWDFLAGSRLWRPLHDMNDAMGIVEHLRTRTTGPRYWCEMRTPWMDGTPYRVGLTVWEFTGWNGRPDHYGIADSLPRAVCLAALKTMEEEKECGD